MKILILKSVIDINDIKKPVVKTYSNRNILIKLVTLTIIIRFMAIDIDIFSNRPSPLKISEARA